jgi:DNA-binding SARP family transcriptional activator
MAKLELNFLGSYAVSQDNLPLTGFESNKVRALLCYLAIESGRPHARETLAGLLWPDWPNSSARSNLRYALADLRKTIHDRQADPPILLITRNTLQFNPQCDYRLDVDEFNSLASIPEGADEDGIEPLERAFELYKGEFLDGFSVPEAAPFEEWARLKREQLHRQYLGLLGSLAAAQERSGEVSLALPYAWRGVEFEPWHEAAQRQLMRLLALDGQRSAALAQYEACRRVLAQELDVEPSLETTQLYESIRDGTLDV